MKTKEDMLQGLTYIGYSGIGFNPNEFKQERIEEIRKIIRVRLVKRKTINLLGYGSYKLKHACEKDEMARGLLKCYVSNGEFIYAMILEGYMVAKCGVNAHFNVTMKSAEDFYDKNFHNDRTPL